MYIDFVHSLFERATLAFQTPPAEPRKSPRGGRKTSRRISENNDDVPEDKSKDLAPKTLPEVIPAKEEDLPAQEEAAKSEQVKPSPPLAILKNPPSLEPMTLIDPVTGMLIPMRESEEGQYIPVANSGHARPIAVPATTAVLAEEGKIEKKVSQPSQPIVSSTSVVVQAPSAVAPSINTTVTASSTPVTATKPTSLKAHVLNASKLSQVQQQIQQQQAQAVLPKSSVPSQPQIPPLVQNVIKQPSLLLPSPEGRPASPKLSPRAKSPPSSLVLTTKLIQVPMAPGQQPGIIIEVLKKVPIDAHPASINAQPLPRILQPESQTMAMKGINGQPYQINPKSISMVPGSVVTPPVPAHLVAAQPVVAAIVSTPSRSTPKPPVRYKCHTFKVDKK